MLDESFRRKFPVGNFENSLGLFFLSLIESIPLSALFKVENDIKNSKDSISNPIIPLNWLCQQAGNNESFKFIATGEHPMVSDFISTSTEPKRMTTNGKVYTEDSIDKNNFSMFIEDYTLTLLSQSEDFKGNTIQIEEPNSEKKSLMTRQESATRCIWEDSQEKTPIRHVNDISNPLSSSANLLSKNIDPIFSSRKKRFFSEEEISSLVEGYERFGPKWTLILDSYPFNGRSSVDLKDKIRNLKKAGLLAVIKTSS